MSHICTKMVKIRKPATCWGCLRTFPKGTVIQKVKYGDEDGIHTTPWCATCLAMMSHMEKCAFDDVWVLGCMVEDPDDGFAAFCRTHPQPLHGTDEVV